MKTLMVLECLPKEFPEVGRFLPKEACQALGMVVRDAPARGGDKFAEAVSQLPEECDPDSPLACSCPRRQFDNPPELLPMLATASNRAELELFIKNWFAARAGQLQRVLQ